MPTVTSKDGTEIAFDREGSGPPLIVVDGAMGNRALGFDRELSSLLAPNLTVYVYDRRGRNESGDTQPYSVEREVEDIEALLDEAGGSGFVYGLSSGGALALEAAARLGGKIDRLAVYEAPYNSPPFQGTGPDDYVPTLRRLLANDERDEAVALFMTIVGVPAEMIPQMRESPDWGVMQSVAHTLLYDAECMNANDKAAIPRDRVSRITVPTLVLNGGDTYDWLKESARELAKAIPNATYRELPGQRHDIDSKILAPILADFFCAEFAPAGR